MGRCPLLKVSALVQDVSVLGLLFVISLKEPLQSILCECILVCPRQNLLGESMLKIETP